MLNQLPIIQDSTKSRLMAISFIVFFVIGASFLLFYEDKHLSSAEQNDWWLVYFENPKDQTADFTIENNSRDASFHWEISIDETKVQQGDISIGHGNLGSIPVKTSDLAGKKITIDVSDPSGSAKEIYKQL